MAEAKRLAELPASCLGVPCSNNSGHPYLEMMERMQREERATVPRSEVMLAFHVLHDLLERAFVLDVHAVVYFLFAVPVVHHRVGFDRVDARVGR